MAYIVDPTDPSQPTGDKPATQGDDELRALKGLVQTLMGGGANPPVNVFRKNLIIGGDFDTNPWQRGISFGPVAPGNLYSADRWQSASAGTMQFTINQLLDAPVINTVYKNKTMDSFAQNCFMLNTSTAQAVLGINDFLLTAQKIEGFNYKPYAQSTLVLSFWHKHTVAGTYCVSIRNSGQDRSYVAEYTQAVADTWEFDSIVIPVPPLTGTWNYTNGVGISINFTFAAGTTFLTPPNVWTVGNFFGTANQVNGVGTLNNKFRIALVQIEAGSLPSKFEFRTYQHELEFCKRYYQKSFINSVAPVQNSGNFGGILVAPATKAGALQNVFPSVRLCPALRALPTLTFYNPSALNGQVRDSTVVGDCSATGAGINSENGFVVTCTGNAGSAVGDQLQVHWSVDAEL